MDAIIPSNATWLRPPVASLEDDWWRRVARTLLRSEAESHEGWGGSPGGFSAPPEPVDGDLELLERVRAGYPHETQAFTELVGRHWSRVWTVCQAVLLNAYDAEEAAQDTFLKVHRYLPSFRGESRFTTWLGRIAHRAAIDRLRTRGREWNLRDTIELDPVSGPGATPTAPFRDGATILRVRAALAKLSPEDRSLLVLRDMEDHSYEEIALMLDIEPGAARMRLTRARGRMREAFQLSTGDDWRLSWQG